jgi:aryl-alcohol dehydrogenase-like predicted oxidoreductase
MTGMRYRQLGNSGLRVSVLAMGTLTFGGRGVFAKVGNTALAEAIRQVDRALDAGINLIDTANAYSGGASEEIVGQALKGRWDRVLIATKARMPVGTGPNDAGLSRHHLIRECEASLRRLGTDHIDLYQTHEWDGATPLDETLSALDDLVHAGKIRYLGSSNFAGWQVAEAEWVSRTRGLERFVSAQNQYSWLERDIEDDLVPALEHYGVGLLPFFPLASGLLTGKYRRGEAAPEGSRIQSWGRESVLTDATFDVLEKLEAFAAERDATLLDIAIGGLAAQRAVSSVIAGATSAEQVKANVAAGNWSPGAPDLAALDEITSATRT